MSMDNEKIILQKGEVCKRPIQITLKDRVLESGEPIRFFDTNIDDQGETFSERQGFYVVMCSIPEWDRIKKILEKELDLSKNSKLTWWRLV